MKNPMGLGVVIIGLVAAACSVNQSLSAQAVVCGQTNFKPRSEHEVAAMTPTELLDEQIRASVAMNSFNSYQDRATYQTLIDKYIRASGEKMIPVLTDGIRSYEPKKSRCDEERLSVSSKSADDIDRFELRIRGTKSGPLLIAELEKSIGRMKDVGFDDRRRDYEDNRRYRIYESYLEHLKGINEVDDAIRDTFWVNRKLAMSDSELQGFSNFLISRDPTYPSWSNTDLIKDNSRINEAGNPLQVYIFTKPERFYAMYQEYEKPK